jgi:hypothetical protein
LYPLPLTIAEERLHTAIDGSLCIQAWLGYGEVLFLGFGDEPLPPRAPEERYPQPPYELPSNLADWWVQEDWRILVTSEDDRADAEAVAESLVGHRAMGWEFIGQSRSLRIRFDGGLVLSVVPFTDEDLLDKDAWAMRGPDGLYLFATCHGELILGRHLRERVESWVALIPWRGKTLQPLSEVVRCTGFQVVFPLDIQSLEDGHPDILLINVRDFGDPGDWSQRLTEALAEKMSGSLSAVPTLLIDPPPGAGWEAPEGITGYDARLPWPGDPDRLSEILHRLIDPEAPPVADDERHPADQSRRTVLPTAEFEARMQKIRETAREAQANPAVSDTLEGKSRPDLDPEFWRLLDEIEALGREEDASRAAWLAELTQIDGPGPGDRDELLSDAALAALARMPDAPLEVGRALCAHLPIDASRYRKAVSPG